MIYGLVEGFNRNIKPVTLLQQLALKILFGGIRKVPFAAISSAPQPILTIIIIIAMTLSIKALVTSLPTVFLQCLICTAGF